jgi:glycosyltransferase involved in cell wall biosynthesis
MPYKIALLLPNLDNPGGITTSVLTFADAFRALGCEVHLFAVGKTEVECTPTIHTIDSNRRGRQIKLFKASYMAENECKSFDITISNNLRTNYILSKLNIKKSLMVFHNARIIQKRGFLKEWREKRYFKKVCEGQNLAFVSRCFQEAFLKKFSNITPKKSYVLYNPIDTKVLDEKALEPIEKLPKRYIVVVGRMVPEKNQEAIIEAFGKLCNKEIDLLLLGEGEERGRLEALSKRLNLTNRVHFMGWKSNPYPYIKHACLLVSASKYEGMPMMLLEALALKVPIVSTDIPCGPNEILTSKLSSFLVAFGNIEQLIETMERALTYYPNISDEMIERFSIETMTRQYMEIMEEVMSKC